MSWRHWRLGHSKGIIWRLAPSDEADRKALKLSGCQSAASISSSALPSPALRACPTLRCGEKPFEFPTEYTDLLDDATPAVLILTTLRRDGP